MVGGNRAFFYPPVPRKAAGGKPVGFVRIYACLIRAGYGHTPDDIGRRFTWRQIQAFFAEEQANTRRARRTRVVDTNAATVGGKSATKHLEQLED